MSGTEDGRRGADQLIVAALAAGYTYDAAARAACAIRAIADRTSSAGRRGSRHYGSSDVNRARHRYVGIFGVALVLVAATAGAAIAVGVGSSGVGWGQVGDTPVPGNYDGVGGADVAVYRNGEWYVMDQPPYPRLWGKAGDVPVPGDYDGDGTTDIAVFRPSEGGWYVQGQPPYPQIWGTAGDMPVPADYDDDGTTDIAVFRPSEGRWYVKPDPVSDVVVAAAGDLCSTPMDCAPSAAVVDAIDPDKVLVLGDNAYPNGSTSDYAAFYAPNWGRFKEKTMPAPGNHEYQTAGASGYFGYFTGVAPYYSFDLGAWHLISLNSEIPVSDGSAQENWLEADLAAVPAGKCILAYWHQPRFSSGQHSSNTAYHQLWVDLYAKGADIVLNGHEHNYERFAKQNPSGVADANGIREFIVGTGGRTLRAMGTTKANSEVRNNNSYGALKLTLNAGSYDWQFVPVAGSSFTDTGSSSC